MQWWPRCLNSVAGCCSGPPHHLMAVLLCECEAPSPALSHHFAGKVPCMWMIYTSQRNGNGHAGWFQQGVRRTSGLKWGCYVILCWRVAIATGSLFRYPSDVFDCDSSFSQRGRRAIQRNTESVHARARVTVCVSVCLCPWVSMNVCVCMNGPLLYLHFGVFPQGWLKWRNVNKRESTWHE